MKTRHQHMLGVLIAAAGMMVLSACGSDNDNEPVGVPTDTPVVSPPTATKVPTAKPTNTTAPTRTNTVPVVVNTNTPTNTVGVTSTPTNTVNGPTNTPVNTNTPTASPTATNTGNATAKCGNGVQEDPEECDNGGTCTTGDNVGALCTSDADCNAIAGACQPTGGDGCANNCTTEAAAAVVVTFDTSAAPKVCTAGDNLGGLCSGNADCPNAPPGSCSSPGGKTRATLQTQTFALPLALAGSQGSFAGKPNADGTVPITIKAVDVKFSPVKVTGLVCACVRGFAVPAFGPGNSGHGIIGCGSQGLSNVNSDYRIDHDIGIVGQGGFTAAMCAEAGGKVEDGSPAHPHEGTCNGPTVVTYSGDGPTGSALISTNTAIGQIADGGSCSTEKKTKVCSGGSNPGTDCTKSVAACTGGGTCLPAKGDDGVPCTDDDPTVAQGTPNTLTTTTGTATSEVLNVNDDGSGDSISADSSCGGTPCVTSVTGVPYDCAQLVNGITTGAASVTAYCSLDATQILDNVVTSVFTSK